MTIYLYHFINGQELRYIYFNGDKSVDGISKYRLKLTSRYSNRIIQQDGPSPLKSWFIELELVQSNERYTTFNMIGDGVPLIAAEFRTGIYNWELQYTGDTPNPSDDPNIEDVFYTYDTGFLKLKTTATDNLTYEGPDTALFPTKHYSGDNPKSQSYILYNGN